ncbi:Spermidine-binding periplasmic protein SpuE [bioreactor metagenome]|uniref:Spermidine-binding periplasmic protein SpuE n=1 Tax=bioreactor metagenome TaxID=1076179 RepID=A0A645E2C5_9ZZZZ
MTLKDNIYSMSIAGPEGPLVSGDVPAAYIYNGSIALAMMDNEDIVPVWPEEGSYIWIDNMCITADSTKKDLANAFINYILDAEVDAKMRNEMPCTDPNKAGWELVDESIRDIEALNIPDEQIKKGQYPITLDTDTLNIYSQMWTEFTK